MTLKNINIDSIVILILIVVSGNIYGQKNADKGDRYFENNLFEEAITYYEIETKKGDSKSKNYAKKQLAECYRLLGNFEEAEDMYRKVLRSKKNQSDPINYLKYGQSLKSSAKFEEAKLQFEKYISLNPEDKLGPVYLHSCDSAQKWLDMGLGKTVKNMEALNTEAPDFSPVILPNNMIVFTSSRDGSKEALISFNGGMKINHLDLYQISLDSMIKGVNKVTPYTGINSGKHEGPMCFTKDMKEIYFTQTVKGYKNKRTGKTVNVLQILHSSYDDSLKVWSSPESNCLFNAVDYSVCHPTLSITEDTLFFVSDMKGGFGGTDLYYSTKNDDGQWDQWINMGSDINTYGYELFPTMAQNGKLYFSSNGHPGMGKLDIFYTKLDRGWWDKPINLATPINSIGDDFGITLDDEGENGFFSSDRFNGVGKDDIYSFTFEAPLKVTLTPSEINFKDNYLFDGLSYKLADADSLTEFPLSKNGNRYFANIENGVRYKLAVRKVFFDVHSIIITKLTESTGSYQVFSLETVNKEFVIDLNDFDQDKSAKRIVLVNSEGEEITNTTFSSGTEKLKLNANESYQLIVGEINNEELQNIINAID